MTTPKNELLFLALGGSNEIGMNVNLYGCEGKWVMVDLGLTFANSEYPGIDLVLPDLEFIEKRKDDLLGIVLTHGHEDHIGAVAYFAADLGVPFYATPFTATLIRGKLEEEGIADIVELNVIPMEGAFSLGPFDFKLVTLAHSILEMSACLITTPYGKIFHTGDWKLDPSPVLGTPSTQETLSAIGDSNVLAMVCDSTNVFNPEPSGSEGSVKDDLLKSVKAAKGRVVVTTFASNAARLQTLADVARESGRTLCFAGRSLHRIIEAAQANGYLKDMPKTVDMESVDSLPRQDVMVVATGGQGEARGRRSTREISSERDLGVVEVEHPHEGEARLPVPAHDRGPGAHVIGRASVHLDCSLDGRAASPDLDDERVARRRHCPRPPLARDRHGVGVDPDGVLLALRGHAREERGGVRQVIGAEVGEDGQRALQGFVLRLLIPRESRGLSPARGKQQQDGLGEVDPLDLRDFTQRTSFVVGL